jgi:hypothetical protein
MCFITGTFFTTADTAEPEEKAVSSVVESYIW